MTRHTVAALVGLGLVAAGVPAAADEHEEMRAAQHELKIAKRHLQAAPRDYEGHRRAAIEHINQALAEVRLGLMVAVEREPRRERRTTTDR
jgi:hypothetical protein